MAPYGMVAWLSWKSTSMGALVRDRYRPPTQKSLENQGFFFFDLAPGEGSKVPVQRRYFLDADETNGVGERVARQAHFL